jgi:hypothetical protein
MSATESTTYKGVEWRREPGGAVAFYDESSGRWVRWAPGVDAPPLPPRWSLFGVATRVTRPGWRSRWKIIPIVLILAALAIAVAQALLPSSTQPASGFVGKCLQQTGSLSGHPSYSTVACDSPKASVKVVRVLQTTNGACPQTTALLLVGVDKPTGICVQRVRHP